MCIAIIMVHTEATKRLLTNIVQKAIQPQSIIAPEIPVRDAHVQTDTSSKFDAIQSRFEQDSALSRDDVNIIIVESNYGTLGSEDINRDVFDYFNKHFPKADLYATSTTSKSLAAALNYNPRVRVLHRDMNPAQFEQDILSNTGESDFTPDAKRIFTISKFKETYGAASSSIERDPFPILNQYALNAATAIVQDISPTPPSSPSLRCR